MKLISALILCFLFSTCAWAQETIPTPPGTDCFTCHGSKDLKKSLSAGRKVSLYINKSQFEKSPHGSLGCTACHGENPHEPGISTSGDWQRYEYNTSQVCEGCHAEAVVQFSGSVHATSGSPRAPNRCTHCHDPHTAGGLIHSQQSIVNTCGGCHRSQEQTYYQTVHGQNLALGDTSVAVCSDCHGYHAVCPVRGRDSCMTSERLAEICSECHSGVTETKIAGWYSHQPRTKAQSAVLFLVESFYVVMIPLILATMILHNILAHRRTLQRRRGEQQDE